MVLPNFLICGGTKCGTTTLMKQLEKHPDVYIPGKGPHGQEIYFFNKHFNKGTEWYEEWFEGWQGETAIGEKTPSYMFHPDVPQRIQRVIPNVKMFFLLRHPVDRAYSEYWMKRRNGVETLGFEEAVENHDFYLNRGKYVKHLERFRAFFDESQLFVSTLRNMKNSPAEFYNTCFDFLGIDKDFVIDDPTQKYNPGRSYRFSVLAKMVDKMRDTGFPPLFLAVIKKVNEYGIRRYPRMDPAVRSKLVEYFRPYNEELLETYGHLDISHWNK